MKSNAEIRRNLGGMPTGHYDMSGMEFSVRTTRPGEEEPSTVPDLLDGVVICLQDCEDRDL